VKALPSCNSRSTHSRTHTHKHTHIRKLACQKRQGRERALYRSMIIEEECPSMTMYLMLIWMKMSTLSSNARDTYKRPASLFQVARDTSKGKAPFLRCLRNIQRASVGALLATLIFWRSPSRVQHVHAYACVCARVCVRLCARACACVWALLPHRCCSGAQDAMLEQPLLKQA